jgi:hypothetical protein
MNLKMIAKEFWRAAFVAGLVLSFAEGLKGQTGDDGSLEPLPLNLDPPSTRENTLVDQPEGYFPTLDDLQYLGDRDSPRGFNTLEGPDGRLQQATGIFPYDRQDNSIYTRYRDALAPLNHLLGFFGPHDAIVIESNRIQNASLTFDGEIPLAFTRTLEPDLAHVRLGPLFIDFLWVGAGAMWTDYNPYGSAPTVDTDDTAAYIDFALRAYLRITDTFYFSAIGNFIYLPLENDFGFATSLGGGGGPAFVATLHWEDQIGSWELLFLDTFVVHTGLSYDWGLGYGDPAIDYAGRYSFGFYGGERESRFDVRSDDFWFSNQVLLRGSTLAFTEDWRLMLQADHTDFWRTFDFEDHAYRDHFGALLGYEGNVIPFAPMLAYDVSTSDHETYRHALSIGLRGRLTENIMASMGGGYDWESGGSEREDWFWYVNLVHTITEGITHGVSFGQQIFEDEYSPETVFATYVRYFLNVRITHQLLFSGWTQWEESERLERRAGERYEIEDFERYSYGAQLSYRPFSYTSVIATATYQNTETDQGRDYENWLYRLSVLQQLASRLTLEGFYHYEESKFEGGGFDEHLLGLTLKRYF